MRVHLNERASKELLEIMKLTKETSTGHTLNKLISQAYLTTIKTHLSEVEVNEPRSAKPNK